MQTGTARGMQTMEQSLADLTLRGVVTYDVALSRSSRPEQLHGILERAGFELPGEPVAAAATLRLAEG
jgi:Tfp pilus assembly ATPase PilU